MELIPLKPEQHQVVLVPKATTDLPFFYHTKKKSLLARNITYEGIDTYGRPIKWKTIPNRDPEIGVPGIDAHDAWMKLVKPAIDLRLDLYDESTYLVPLGGCRESLRMVGWGEGGFQARRLLRALNQIGNTNIVADIWIPTTETHHDGQPLFQPIKASFTKMSIYAIGSTHLTTLQLQEGRFDFDFKLDDTIYVQLHPVEAQIQKSQPQRYIDNQYLFSVGPAAQRCYELLAAKIYGVVKNNGHYCEVRYSWYIKHHHTLKRHHERRRVVQQIKEVIRDHLRSRYLIKVEFNAVTEPGQEIDWVIRFYPGEEARASINRVLKHTPNHKGVTPARRKEQETITAQIYDKPTKTESVPGFDLTLLSELTKRGITKRVATKLFSESIPDQSVMDQLEWADYIVSQGNIKNPPGLYVTFVRDNVIPPEWFETNRVRKEKYERLSLIKTKEQEEEAQRLAYENYRRQQIDQYIADNPIRYQESYNAKNQEALVKYPGLSQWKPELAERFISSLAHAAIAGDVDVDTFEYFRSKNQIAGLLPAPRNESSGPETPPSDTTETQYLVV